MPMVSSEFPDITGILREELEKIEPAMRPLMLAAMERFAAERYRIWASTHEDADEKAGLLECAEREEEIAGRIESLYPDARAKQADLLAEHTDIATLGKRLFRNLPVRSQWEMQCEGEKAGANAWRQFAEAADSDEARAVFKSCAPLETKNADFLRELLLAHR